MGGAGEGEGGVRNVENEEEQGSNDEMGFGTMLMTDGKVSMVGWVGVMDMGVMISLILRLIIRSMIVSRNQVANLVESRRPLEYHAFT
jgi:hypothetical protein